MQDLEGMLMHAGPGEGCKDSVQDSKASPITFGGTLKP